MPELDKYSVKWWLDAIGRAQKGDDGKWRERAKKVQKLYDGESEKDAEAFNVLWTNTQTMLPSLYSNQPRPDIRNRFVRPQDPLGPLAKGVATVLERGISYQLDQINFQGVAVPAVLDYLVAGRGTMRVRYTPLFGDGDPVRYSVELAENGELRANGKTVADEDVQSNGNGGYYVEQPGPERKVWEDVRPEHVYWADLIHPKVKRWDLMPWIAFRHELDEDEVASQFGKAKASNISYGIETQDTESKAEVFEVWCKLTGKVYVVTEGYDEFLLKEDDPLELAGFFPMPEPIYSVPRSGSLVPKPEYTMYQELAAEVNELTQRIKSVAGAIRGRGVYPKECGELLNLLADSGDAELVPVENWHSHMEKGGLAGIIDWLPVQQMSEALVSLVRERNNAMQTIYEITGISDILRGVTDHRETRGAQELKTRFGTKRLALKGADIERLFRDTYRLMAEIMAEHFDAQTLTLMSGYPVTEQHTQLMNSDVLRTFAVDIETDSTVAVDDQKEKGDAIEVLGAVGQYMEQIGPLIEKGVLPFEAAKAGLKFVISKFKAGKDIEEMVEAMQAPQQGPSMAEQLEAKDIDRRIQEGQAREASRAKETDAKVILMQADALEKMSNAIGDDDATQVDSGSKN